jgi:hypothetical protein
MPPIGRMKLLNFCLAPVFGTELRKPVSDCGIQRCVHILVNTPAGVLMVG